ncbi:MAG TPA: hypothetical protein VGK20_14540 [Candidatus Binatia bacterium]
MILHRTRATGLAALATCTAALLALGGCAGQQSLSDMPGLADVRPLGPDGQKCFDFCASSEVACKDMCPEGGDFVGECHTDCLTDTKYCLADCPNLQRPEPAPKN